MFVPAEGAKALFNSTFEEKERKPSHMPELFSLFLSICEDNGAGTLKRTATDLQTLTDHCLHHHHHHHEALCCALSDTDCGAAPKW